MAGGRTVLAGALAGAGLLGGCSPTAELSPGPSATGPECVDALQRAPQSVLGQARTPSDVPGTLSWGSPAIIVRCGLSEIGPTTATCLEVDGVDWVLDTDSDPMTATSYGRSPAVEVRLPASYGREALPAALVDAGPIAAALPTTGRACIG